MKYVKMDDNTVAAVADTVYANLLKAVAGSEHKSLGDAVMAEVEAENPGVKLHDGFVAADPWKVGSKKANDLVAETMKLAESKKAEREKERTSKRIEKLQAQLAEMEQKAALGA